jgi:hypothetical protein
LLNPNSKTAHFRRPVEFLELEGKLHKWVKEIRQEYIPVRTNIIIAQAVNLDVSKTFKNGNAQKISRWVSCFLEQWNLSIHRVTKVEEKLFGHLLQMKKDTTAAIKSRFLPGGTLENDSPHFFINVDLTAVYLNQCVFLRRKLHKMCGNGIPEATQSDVQLLLHLPQMVQNFRLFLLSKANQEKN